MSELTEAVEIGPADASHVIIWLHGLGADGHDFEPIVPELKLSDMAPRFIFPHAPIQPVTINGGMHMRAWYDIRSAQIEQLEDEAGIRQSQAAIEALIEKEVDHGIDSRHIILAGFSQGGAIALQTGLRYPQSLGGILALSTYLPLAASLDAERSDTNRATPVLMAHGESDPIVPLALAEKSRQLLQQAGYPVEWKVYPMQHQICMEEIEDIGEWIRSRFVS